MFLFTRNTETDIYHSGRLSILSVQAMTEIKLHGTGFILFRLGMLYIGN